MNSTLLSIYAFLLTPLCWIIFLFGVCFGSFLNVMISRLPFDQFFADARSHCLHCRQPIPAYLNIPLLSYLLLGGRSQCCSKVIPIRYFWVEVFGGVVSIFIFWFFPFIQFENFIFTKFDPAEFLRFSHAIVFVYLTFVCAVIDMEHMIIPDWISLPMIGFSPLVSYLHPDLDFQSSMIGVFVGGVGLYLFSWLYFLLRRNIGLGMGDVKLLAAIGGWLGYQSLGATLLFGSLLGAVFGMVLMISNKNYHLKTALPFGPFLVIGCWLYFFAGHQIFENILIRN